MLMFAFYSYDHILCTHVYPQSPKSKKTTLDVFMLVQNLPIAKGLFFLSSVSDTSKDLGENSLEDPSSSVRLLFASPSGHRGWLMLRLNFEDVEVLNIDMMSFWEKVNYRWIFVRHK